ncbi:MAG TPA: gluconate 2-dehydrogenase subunit 3 family protein [Gemmatimonadales bacterium]|nr:gluconate 2-dehydrogenase subunit 3 family protein [Gemmatimonadales bacterium]
MKHAGSVVRHSLGLLRERAPRAMVRAAGWLSPAQRSALRRREREALGEGLGYFTAREGALLSAVAELIVPSDESGPGIRDLLRAGRPIAPAIERQLRSAPAAGALYTRGLAALDHLARRTFGAEFVKLSTQQQIMLLGQVDHMGRAWSADAGLAAKLRNRTIALYHQWTGVAPAVELFPVLVHDVMRTFYVDPASWAWLAYDGPPLPHGYYPDLRERPVREQGGHRSAVAR